MAPCEFMLRKVKPSTGSKALLPCGEPAVRYSCAGGLTSVVLDLCEEHRDYVITKYGWKVKKVSELNPQTERSKDELTKKLSV